MKTRKVVRGPLEARFWPKVDVRGPEECWPWTAGCYPNGYGMIRAGGKGSRHLLAHRVAYGIAVGQMPTVEFILHRCDNPPCCNPAHLFAGSQADNMHDMFAKGRQPTRVHIGERNSRAVITERLARELRNKFLRWPQTPKGYRIGAAASLSRKYGLSRALVNDVVFGKSWRHLWI